MNSCSLAEMMLLRWALCSLQSFSASSQVCLCVKYLWRDDHGKAVMKNHISHTSRADLNVTNGKKTSAWENNSGLEQTLMQIEEANTAEGLLTAFRAEFWTSSLFIPVAVAVELPPTVLAAFDVCGGGGRREEGELDQSHKGTHRNTERDKISRPGEKKACFCCLLFLNLQMKPKTM